MIFSKSAWIGSALLLVVGISTIRAEQPHASDDGATQAAWLTGRVSEMDAEIRELRQQLAEIDGHSPPPSPEIEQTSANVPLPAPPMTEYVPPSTTGYTPLPVEKALAEKP